MKKPYQKTMYACFIGYIVQAIVNNFVPLLFVTFQTDYRVPPQKITLLITVNFLIQLCVDLLSAGFIDRIGYRASVLLAHGFAAAGLILLTILPDRTADPFVGILLAVVVYALGGGLLEVLVSPILEACPTDNKASAMSLLHSFYCWGQMGVVPAVHPVLFRLWYRQLESAGAGVGGGAHLKRRAFCHRADLSFEPGGRRGSDLKGTVPQQGVLVVNANDAGRRCGGEYR